MIYTVLLSVIDPAFWLHPFGPLTKNAPMLVLIWLLAEECRKQTRIELLSALARVDRALSRPRNDLVLLDSPINLR